LLMRFGTKSLFLRVFLHGLIVLVAFSVTFVAFGALLVRPEVDRKSWELSTWLAPEVCSHLANLKDPRERPPFMASAYLAEGQLAGSLVTPPLPPLSAELVARLRVEKAIALPGRPIHAFWCADSPRATYVELGPPLPRLTGGMLVPFACLVLVVALASVPLARSIARPIAELVRVTQAFGRGELGVRTQITRRDEVGELASAFNQMATRLQRLILAEKELLANVSHELRTPLARIRVVLETALEKPERAQGLLREIGTDLGDLERLVEAVMGTMRLDMGASVPRGAQLPALLEPTDVAAAARDAADRFRGLHPECQLLLALEENVPDAETDPRLLRRLLDNLLDNARKYSLKGSPIVLRVCGLEAARVTTSDGDEPFVRIEVIDRGVGIDSADLPYVFEPFFRGAQSRARAATGAGLGLALAKKIVDAHDGHIGITSTVGIGTTICVTLIGRPDRTLSQPAGGCSRSAPTA